MTTTVDAVFEFVDRCRTDDQEGLAEWISENMGQQQELGEIALYTLPPSHEAYFAELGHSYVRGVDIGSAVALACLDIIRERFHAIE